MESKKGMGISVMDGVRFGLGLLIAQLIGLVALGAIVGVLALLGVAASAF